MTDIHTRIWPLTGAKGAVVIVHGMAEHSGRYEHVAQALNGAGYAVYALDLRGHGRSVGFPGDMGSDVHQVVSDIVALVEQAHAEHPKTFLLAHSMGTLFASVAAMEASGRLSGIVLSGLATQPGEAVLAAMGSPEPSLPAEMISRSPEVVQAYVDDPLVFKTVTQSVMTVALSASEPAQTALRQLTLPVLLLHGTDDKLCAIQGAHEAYAEMIVNDKTVRAYEGLYHEVLNEPEREQVIADLISWLDAH